MDDEIRRKLKDLNIAKQEHESDQEIKIKNHESLVKAYEEFKVSTINPAFKNFSASCKESNIKCCYANAGGQRTLKGFTSSLFILDVDEIPEITLGSDVGYPYYFISFDRVELLRGQVSNWIVF